MKNYVSALLAASLLTAAIATSTAAPGDKDKKTAKATTGATASATKKGHGKMALMKGHGKVSKTTVKKGHGKVEAAKGHGKMPSAPTLHKK
jgi:hypothetical protein